ncbi:MAG: MerR family transcriptional regulator, thiopeptide resistance regulator [Microbacteriaceae bacterium]|nr:MerR family transcriptional regulator, thiopeptide resistance regulator [Microbacteriaceae bacterium]
MSGVTARTLRHYDDIGLLTPASVGGNGYRRYGDGELLRLQRILVLRALGLGLADIAAVLEEQTDEVAALREHHGRLLAERDRLARMAETVERTIRELSGQEGKSTMTIDRPENLFEGFDPAEYEAEARERWPEEHASSKRFTDTLSPDDTKRMQREMTAQMVRMAGLRAAGTPAVAEAVQNEIDDLYRSVSRMWTPNAEAFAGLGRMYVEDPRFTATYDRVSPGLAEYYRDAMAVYAKARLS